jgi:DNA-binding XRE family transcriptional regulator
MARTISTARIGVSVTGRYLARALLKQLLAGPEPRELTLATRDPALLRLPWELMTDEAGHLAQRVSVRRQLETPEETTPRPAQLPLRILYIVSRPADADIIDPRLTAKALFDALDPLGGSVRVDFCRPPTLVRMEEVLREGQQAGEAPAGLSQRELALKLGIDPSTVWAWEAEEVQKPFPAAVLHSECCHVTAQRIEKLVKKLLG